MVFGIAESLAAGIGLYGGQLAGALDVVLAVDDGRSAALSIAAKRMTRRRRCSVALSRNQTRGEGVSGVAQQEVLPQRSR